MRLFHGTELNEVEEQALYQLELGINGFKPIVNYDSVIKIKGYVELTIIDESYYDSFVKRNNYRVLGGRPLFLAGVNNGSVSILNLVNLASIIKDSDSYLTNKIGLLKNCNQILLDNVSIKELCNELLELEHLELIQLINCQVRDDDSVIQSLINKGVKVIINGLVN